MQRSILVPTARRVKSETHQKVTPKGKRETSTPKPKQSRKAAIPEADQPLPFDGEDGDTPSFI